MTTETFKTLLAGYYAGTLTGEQKMELSALLHDPQYREQLEQLFTEDFADPDISNAPDAESLELMYQYVQLRKQPAPVRRVFPYKWVAAAAVVLMTTAATYFLFFQPKRPDIAHTGDTLINDIAAPAYSRAVLLLADGKEIIVDSTANGQLAVQENINIIKTGEGQLMYVTDESVPAGSGGMNTLTIPAGSRPLQLALTDGTMVWLNASSSITYPVAFTGNARKVSVTGEAYFEVAKSPAGKIPFIVQKGDMDVQVLGTHFNVNAYDDEAESKVTLLEGKVKVTARTTQQSTLLSPGEQAVLTNKSELNTQNSVNLEQVMAWKEGVFDFSGADIQSVMRQLARWYNVQVDYQGKITTNHFSGIISRNNNISQVLKMLQSTGGVSFKIETGSPSGQKGKVIVLP